MFFEFHGLTLAAGSTVVRWTDGDWSGPDEVIADLKRAQADGQPVALTPTGPMVPPTSPEGSRELARQAFVVVDSFDTDSRFELPPLPPGAVS